MSFLKTEKTSFDEFTLIDNLSQELDWLDDPDYQQSLLALLKEFNDIKSKQLIIKLLKRMKHLHDREMKKHAQAIVKNIEEWNLEPKSVIMVALADEGDVDGSIAGLNFLKPRLSQLDGWSELMLFSTFEVAVKSISDGVVNVLIFDDFVGSGKTMVKKVTAFKELLQINGISSVTIRIVCFAGMSEGLNKIKDELDLEVCCPIILKKGISDYEKDPEDKESKELMAQLEQNLQKKIEGLNIKSFSLGYDGSETLYQVFGHNCPNNVFPIFWWPKLKGGVKRNTLFQRLR